MSCRSTSSISLRAPIIIICCLTGGTDNAPFSSQVYVNGTGPATPTGGPLSYSTIKPYSAPLNGTIKYSCPPMSVIYLVADNK
jgi:hypothetical protein